MLRRGFPGLAIGGPPPGPPPEMKGWMLERLDRELDLTAAQHARIDTVLTRREADLRALMSEARPRFEAIATRTRTEIQAVLTPTQQEKFAKITQQDGRARRGRAAEHSVGRRVAAGHARPGATRSRLACRLPVDRRPPAACRRLPIRPPPERLPPRAERQPAAHPEDVRRALGSTKNRRRARPGMHAERQEDRAPRVGEQRRGAASAARWRRSRPLRPVGHGCRPRDARAAARSGARR